jgi:hypothetical protein
MMMPIDAVCACGEQTKRCVSGLSAFFCSLVWPWRRPRSAAAASIDCLLLIKPTDIKGPDLV